MWTPSSVIQDLWRPDTPYGTVSKLAGKLTELMVEKGIEEGLVLALPQNDLLTKALDLAAKLPASKTRALAASAAVEKT